MRLSCEIGLPSLSGTPLALVVRESAELSRILNLSDFAKLARYVFAYPNPGLSSDSKTQGGIRVHGLANGLSAGGLLGSSCPKQGEGRVSCTKTFI